MFFKKQALTTIAMSLLLVFLWWGNLGATCFSHTKEHFFRPTVTGSYSWDQTITDLPDGFVGISATVEMRVQVQGGLNSWLDIYCSDNTAPNNPVYYICRLAPSLIQIVDNFSVRTFTLEAEQIEWLTNDRTLHFFISAQGASCYFDYFKLTVCGPESSSNSLMLLLAD
jgi:hypothetical protein